jgi:2-polyprenyl-3-methyl-5-hydroxy-6-metoxy-1,4-benzoquinol methylase
MLGDMGGAASGALVLLGDQLGLFAAIAEHGPGTSAELAAAAGVDERYLREWLSCMAASGYVDYDAAGGKFSMNPEQAAVLANPDSPVALAGAYYGIASMYIDEPKLNHAFRTGGGVSWGDHHPCLFCGTAKFFRPGYAHFLINDWLPALEGMVAKLESGARVADVGCGHGCSTTIMAKAFPNSQFTGYDYHAQSIEAARALAEDESVSNVNFDVASAKDYPGNDYDLVAFFDCLHDMGDPAGAAAHVRNSLKPDGTWLLVEPMAGDTLSENLNPVGRLYYAFSTMICTPASKAQEVGLALGAQAGEKRLREVVVDGGGFTRFRRATQTPFNLILEARP